MASADGASTTVRASSSSRHPEPRLAKSTGISTAAALNLAFVGEPCEFVQADGTSRVMAVHRWTRDASPADMALFVDVCRGPTLDVGCGPGWLTAAVTDRGFQALGIDISGEAVLQTRACGAMAVCQDVFVELSGSRAWQHVLLADGNIGLGGDPVRLLKRIGQLLAADGSALVELAGPGVGTVHEQVRLRVGDRMSPPFSWATVGVDTIEAVAGQADLVVERLRHDSGRYVATLRHAEARR